jgi:hypothetical protein
MRRPARRMRRADLTAGRPAKVREAHGIL